MSIKSKFKRLLTVSVLLLVGTLFLRAYHATTIHPPQNDRAFAFKLYTAILNATQSSKGIVHVKFRAVSQKTQSAHFVQNAFWRVSPDTNAQITFDLQNNKWQQLIVDFGDHPLVITLAVDTPIPGTIRVGKITYGRDGRVKDLYEPGAHSAITEFVRKGQTHADSIGFYSEALTALKIVPQVASLLTEQNLSAGPLRFDSVEIRENSQDNLRVDLLPDTKFPLGINNSNGCDFDSLNLTGSIPLSFAALSYEASTKKLTSAISAFTANVSDACLTSGKTVLRMGPSQIEISQLRFGQRTMDSSFLSLQASLVESQLTSGSSLVLTQNGERQSEISPIDAANLKASGLGFEVKEDGTKVLSLASAQVTTGNATGMLAPDLQSDFSFKTSKSGVSIVSAEWTSNAAPKMQGALSPMQIEITSGDLVFNSTNKLSIQSGVAQTEELTIDTSRPGPLSGALLPTSVVFGETSVIGSTSRFALEAQGSLISNPSNRIVFSGEGQGINGQVNLRIPNTKGKIDFGITWVLWLVLELLRPYLLPLPAAHLQGESKVVC
jgi:hypothetical protein